MHAKAERGEIPMKTVHEFDKATDFAHLPEKKMWMGDYADGGAVEPDGDEMPEGMVKCIHCSQLTPGGGNDADADDVANPANMSMEGQETDDNPLVRLSMMGKG